MMRLSKHDLTPLTRQRRLMLITLAWLGVALLIFAAHAMGATRQVRALAQDPYPAPPSVDSTSPDNGNPTDGLALPYPAPTDSALGIVGESSQAVPVQPSDPDFGVSVPLATAPAQQSSAGLYFLWGGFLAALLIFATAIVGSVVLFTRRVE